MSVARLLILQLRTFDPKPGVYAVTCFHMSCRLAVSEIRLALPDFDNITIRIAHVAERLAVLVLWLCDKLGSSTSP